MGELQSALDALAGAELFGLSDAEHVDGVAALVAARNRIEAELARRVRAAANAQACERDGLRSMASWLRGHCRLSSAAAFRIVRAGRTLEHLPAVAAAAAAGAVSPEQVTELAKAVTPHHLGLAAEQGVDLAAVDAVFAEVAARRPHDELVEVVGRYTAWLDQDGPEPDPTEGRSLSITKHSDGTVSGRFELDAAGGEKVQTVLESFVQADRPAGDGRTRAQQQGDALVQWADVTLAAGHAPILRTVKPHVAVTLDAEDLADPGTGPGAARMGFGAVISAARARWLACDGQIGRIVFGPDGAPLDLGRSHRVVPPHLRKAVEARDRHCVFAGCQAPSHWADVHHLVHWADGGETSLENSALLCERHHGKVHSGFRIERDPEGRWHTYRPDGTEIQIQPLLRC